MQQMRMTQCTGRQAREAHLQALDQAHLGVGGGRYAQPWAPHGGLGGVPNGPLRMGPLVVGQILGLQKLQGMLHTPWVSPLPDSALSGLYVWGGGGGGCRFWGRVPALWLHGACPA